MKTIGKFQVVEKIGEGGFGVIYKGLDPHIKRHVAIKSCTSADEAVRNRFVQEAQISGNLHHRHIVTVYDFGLEDGVPYLVQEYLNGEDLDRKIKRRDHIPFPEKLLYLMQIARGLEYAHSQGVIHRDIKPANLRILEDGTAKIMDFGIAKLTNQDTGLTQTGMTLGTAAYLAPEQIRGEAVDPRTDIFAYGATAYELLTYRRPFVGQHISTVLYQILNEEPPKVTSILPEAPPELDTLIERCLEKDLSKRYSDVGELLHDLNRLIKKRTEITTKSIDPPTVKVPQVTAEELQGEDEADAKTRVSSHLGATASTEAPASAPAATATRPVAARTNQAYEGTASAELHEIELDGTGETARTPHGIDASQILQRRQFQWGPWAAGVVVLAAIALGAWTFFAGRAAPPSATEVATAEGVADPENSTATSTPTTEGAEIDDPTQSPLAADTETDGSGATLESDGPATEGEATDGADDEAEPAAEEPPVLPGRIVLPAAWSSQITVGIGDQTYTLDRGRQLELAPGIYTLRFRLDLEGYSDSAQRSVEVTSDGTHSVSIPIAPPGLLDVQPKLSSPQKGYVYLGQTLLGPSPVRGRRLKPGQHTLRVVADLGPDQPAIETPITIQSGNRLIVTFDLASGDMIQRDAGPQ